MALLGHNMLIMILTCYYNPPENTILADTSHFVSFSYCMVKPLKWGNLKPWANFLGYSLKIGSFMSMLSYSLKASLFLSFLPDIEGILPKGPYPPCLRMADRALLAGYPQYDPLNTMIQQLQAYHWWWEYRVECMMISWNGNVFCITGTLWGESTGAGHQWIPFTKGQ